MTAFSLAVSGILGLLIGSFLNVVVWRLPRNESLVSPGSHCPSCEQPVRARDNVPVVSWLLLRGRCRDCRSRISARYPAVELTTGVIFVVLAWSVGLRPAVVGFLFLGATGLAMALIDIDVRRLPNALTFPNYAVGLSALLAQSAVDHNWWPFERAVIGMAVLWLFYAVLWLLGGMGFGDVKLAGVLGLYLGWLGWGSLVVGAFLAFAIGAVAGVGLMLAGRSGMKSRIPYGPYMLVGALLAILAGPSIASGYTHLVFGG